MERQVDGPLPQLGLVILSEGRSPTIDIVAVHGLGANPSWAWVRKVHVDSGASGEERKVNWLADPDLLPAKIPHARIMAFNYESKWHKDAPKQRHSLCADQLLTALDNMRKEENSTEHRPLMFIGHSFGGIVIEQALVSANSRAGFQYLATSTVGIIFLGTLHRGTQASKWGELIAVSGKLLGLGSQDKILKDLQKDSEGLTDLLYNFTLWLSRISVPTVCFFEQHMTDYGTRAGKVVTWKELVVEEKSACIDGHRKEALPTDHLKINKNKGLDDPCYKIVYPIISDMTKSALEKVQRRLDPQPIIQDNSTIQRSKGERVKGTCEWLLVQEKYTSWLVGDNPQLLQLVGGPGIGKTMISSFLVEELENRAQKTPAMTLAYYFCDNKDEKRNTAIAIIRGLLLQLLRQHPILFKHIQQDYEQMEGQLFDNFDALWRILRSMLKDPNAGEVYILVDALDECKKSSRGDLLKLLPKLFSAPRTNGKLNVKFLITCRPELDIKHNLQDSGLEHGSGHLRIDSGKVNTDLSKFIQERVRSLSKKNAYPPKLTQEVKDALDNKAGRTFLWAALVLQDLGKETDKAKVLAKLQDLPSDLNQVYDRILSHIDPNHEEDAKFVLCCVVVARRPLTVDELAMAYALGPGKWEENTLPGKDFLDLRNDKYKFCEPLVYVDEESKTVNLVHQSAKDYLLSDYLSSNYLPSNSRLSASIVPRLSAYSIILLTGLHSMRLMWTSFLAITLSAIAILVIAPFTTFPSATMLSKLLASPSYNLFIIYTYNLLAILEEANCLIFKICWRYLSRDEFEQGTKIIERGLGSRLRSVSQAKKFLDDHCFLQYAAQEWQEHALAASPTLVTQSEWFRNNLGKMPTLGDVWLYKAAAGGHEAIVRQLLKHKAQINAKNQYGESALQFAANNGYETVVQLLLEHKVEVNAKDVFGKTALHNAALIGHKTVVQQLLKHKAKINAKNKYGKTALHFAVNNGHETVVQLLLKHKARIDTKDNYGKTALDLAASRGHEAIVQLLAGWRDT